jgi:hypothetical protein
MFQASTVPHASSFMERAATEQLTLSLGFWLCALSIITSASTLFSFLSPTRLLPVGYLHNDGALAVCCWLLLASTVAYAWPSMDTAVLLCVTLGVALCLFVEQRRKRGSGDVLYVASFPGLVMVLAGSPTWRENCGDLREVASREWGTSKPISAIKSFSLHLTVLIYAGLLLLLLLHLIRGWTRESSSSLEIFAAAGVPLGGSGKGRGGYGNKRQRKRQRLMKEFARRTSEQVDGAATPDDGMMPPSSEEALRAAGYSVPASVETQLFWVQTLCHLLAAVCFLVLAITLRPEFLCFTCMWRAVGVWYLGISLLRSVLYLLVFPLLRRLHIVSASDAAFLMHLLWKFTRLVHGALMVPPIFDFLVGSPRGNSRYQQDVILEFQQVLMVRGGVQQAFEMALMASVTGFNTGLVHESLMPLTRHQAFKRWTDSFASATPAISYATPLVLNLGHFVAIGVALSMYGINSPPLPFPPRQAIITLAGLLAIGAYAIHAGCATAGRVRSWGEVSQAMLHVGAAAHKGATPSLSGVPSDQTKVNSHTRQLPTAAAAIASAASASASAFTDSSGSSSEAAVIESRSSEQGSAPASAPTPAPAPVVVPALAPATAATASDEAGPPSSEPVELDLEGNASRQCDALCIVCDENPHTHAFVPCGHYCVCKDCGDALLDRGQPCPLCRTDAIMLIKVY